MEVHARHRLASGLALIVLGLTLYWLNRVEGIGHAAILFLIGGIFLAAYFYRREYGFLIPGCILLGLGLASVGRDSFFDFGNATLLGLAAGFLGIFVIGLLYERRASWWPLVPGGVLALVAIGETRKVFRFLLVNWPLVLVFFGVMILLSALGKPKRSA